MVEAYPSLREAISEVARGTVMNEEEQLLAIEKFEFVTGSDVFVSLPTGFGKSLIYRLLPAVFNRLKVYRKPTSFALIVSPLTSLVINQKGRVSSARYQREVSRRSSGRRSCIATGEGRPAPISILDPREPLPWTKYSGDTDD